MIVNSTINKRERSKKKPTKFCFLSFRHKIKITDNGGARCIYCGRLKSQCIDPIVIKSK